MDVNISSADCKICFYASGKGGKNGYLCVLWEDWGLKIKPGYITGCPCIMENLETLSASYSYILQSGSNAKTLLIYTDTANGVHIDNVQYRPTIHHLSHWGWCSSWKWLADQWHNSTHQYTVLIWLSKLALDLRLAIEIGNCVFVESWTSVQITLAVRL